MLFKQNSLFTEEIMSASISSCRSETGKEDNKQYQYMINCELLSAWQSLIAPYPLSATPHLPIYYWSLCKWIYHQYDLWNIPPLMISMSSTGITQFVINWAANSGRSKNSSRGAVSMDTGPLITIDISLTATTSVSLTWVWFLFEESRARLHNSRNSMCLFLDWTHYYCYLCLLYMKIKLMFCDNYINKQECIPVGCEPPALYRTGGGLLAREVIRVRETPCTPFEQNDRQNITLPKTSFAGGNKYGQLSKCKL